MKTTHQKKFFTCNEQLQYAVDNSRIALWDWCIPTGEVSFSPLWAEIIGYTLEELAPVSIKTWIEHTHPDDLVNANIALQAHFLGESEYYECELRMQHRLGHWVWILDRGKVVEWDNENKPMRMIGSHQDINHQHQLTENLMLSELRLKTLISNMFAGILLEDENRKVLLTNQALIDMFHIPLQPEEMIGFDCALAAKSSAANFVDPDAFLKDIEDKLAKRKHTEGHELVMRDGKVLSQDFIPIDRDGKQLGLLWVYRDISKSKHLEDHLRELSETDELTGIANRRYFMNALTESINKTNENNWLALIDIDHFKQVNDQYGHLVGDQVLIHLTHSITKNLRKTDLMGRIGGEEFAILLNNTDEVNAIRILERERCHIMNTPCEVNSTSVHYSISIGLTKINANDTVSSTLSRADQALYCAKDQGRNRLIFR